MIPFILLGVSTVAGLTGVLKGAEGISNCLKAKNIVEKNRQMYEKKKEQLELHLKELSEKINEMIEWKIRLNELKKLIKDDLRSLDNNVIVMGETGMKYREFIDNLESNITGTDEILGDLAEEGIGGVVKAALSSYTTYWGAVEIATNFGVASTGTAISSLSGAAAENAILAWFGGGSVATGGGGVALGSVVLTGITAGPALFFLGMAIAKSSEKFLTKASEDEYKIKKAIDLIDLKIEEIKELIKWLKLYSSACLILEEGIKKLLSKVKNSSEKEIRVYVDKIISLTEKVIAKLIELDFLKLDGYNEFGQKVENIVYELNILLEE